MDFLLLCGDDRVYFWNPPFSKENINSQNLDVRVLCTGNVSVTCIISKITHILNQCPKNGCLIVYTLINDMTARAYNHNFVLKKGLIEVLKDQDINMLVEKMNSATEEWNKIKPDLNIIWALPTNFDVLQFNSNILFMNSQDPMCDREVNRSIQNQKLFDQYITELAQIINLKYSQLKTLDISLLLANNGFDPSFQEHSSEIYSSEKELSLQQTLHNYLIENKLITPSNSQTVSSSVSYEWETHDWTIDKTQCQDLDEKNISCVIDFNNEDMDSSDEDNEDYNSALDDILFKAHPPMFIPSINPSKNSHLNHYLDFFKLDVSTSVGATTEAVTTSNEKDFLEPMENLSEESMDLHSDLPSMKASQCAPQNFDTAITERTETKEFVPEVGTDLDESQLHAFKEQNNLDEIQSDEQPTDCLIESISETDKPSECVPQNCNTAITEGTETKEFVPEVGTDIDESQLHVFKEQDNLNEIQSDEQPTDCLIVSISETDKPSGSVSETYLPLEQATETIDTYKPLNEAAKSLSGPSESANSVSANVQPLNELAVVDNKNNSSTASKSFSKIMNPATPSFKVSTSIAGLLKRLSQHKTSDSKGIFAEDQPGINESVIVNSGYVAPAISSASDCTRDQHNAQNVDMDMSLTIGKEDITETKKKEINKKSFEKNGHFDQTQSPKVLPGAASFVRSWSQDINASGTSEMSAANKLMGQSLSQTMPTKHSSHIPRPNVIFVGDNRVHSLSSLAKSSCNSTSHSGDKVNLSIKEAVVIANEHLTSSTNILVMMPFHDEITFTVKHYTIIKPVCVVECFKHVVYDSTLEWKEKYPNLRVIWMLPFLIDLKKFNRNKMISSGREINDVFQKILDASVKYNSEYENLVQLIKNMFADCESKPNMFEVDKSLEVCFDNDGFSLSSQTNVEVWQQLRAFAPFTEEGDQHTVAERVKHTHNNYNSSILNSNTRSSKVNVTQGVSRSNCDYLIIGDTRVHDLCSQVNSVSYYFQPNISLNEAIALTWKHVTSETKLVILLPFHNELLFEKELYSFVKPSYIIGSIVKMVDMFHFCLKQKFPLLRVFWVLPFAIDFELYNRVKANKVSRKPSDVELKILNTSSKYTTEYVTRVNELKTALEENLQELTVLQLDKYLDLSFTNNGFSLTQASSVQAWKLMETLTKKMLAVPIKKEAESSQSLLEKHNSPRVTTTPKHMTQPSSKGDVGNSFLIKKILQCKESLLSSELIIQRQQNIYSQNPNLHPFYDADYERFTMIYGYDCSEIEWKKFWHSSLIEHTQILLKEKYEEFFKVHGFNSLQHFEEVCTKHGMPFKCSNILKIPVPPIPRPFPHQQKETSIQDFSFGSQNRMMHKHSHNLESYDLPKSDYENTARRPQDTFQRSFNADVYSKEHSDSEIIRSERGGNPGPSAQGFGNANSISVSNHRDETRFSRNEDEGKRGYGFENRGRKRGRDCSSNNDGFGRLDNQSTDTKMYDPYTGEDICHSQPTANCRKTDFENRSIRNVDTKFASRSRKLSRFDDDSFPNKRNDRNWGKTREEHKQPNKRSYNRDSYGSNASTNHFVPQEQSRFNESQIEPRKRFENIPDNRSYEQMPYNFSNYNQPNSWSTDLPATSSVGPPVPQAKGYEYRQGHATNLNLKEGCKEEQKIHFPVKNLEIEKRCDIQYGVASSSVSSENYALPKSYCSASQTPNSARSRSPRVMPQLREQSSASAPTAIPSAMPQNKTVGFENLSKDNSKAPSKLTSSSSIGSFPIPTISDRYNVLPCLKALAVIKPLLPDIVAQIAELDKSTMLIGNKNPITIFEVPSLFVALKTIKDRLEVIINTKGPNFRSVYLQAVLDAIAGVSNGINEVYFSGVNVFHIADITEGLDTKVLSNQISGTVDTIENCQSNRETIKVKLKTYLLELRKYKLNDNITKMLRK